MKLNKAAGSFALIGGIFLVIGLVFFIAGIALFGSYLSFRKTGIKTEAVITDIKTYHSSNSKSDSHTVWIRYEAEDGEHTGTAGYYSSGMRVGDTITVYYDPLNPYKTQSGVPVMELVFTFMGAVFGGVGGLFLSMQIKQSANRKRLLAEGIPVSGIITAVTIDRTLKVNGRHPRQVEVEVTDPYTGQRTYYTSEGYMNDLEPYIGCSVTVFLDSENSGKYYVDLSGLSDIYPQFENYRN